MTVKTDPSFWLEVGVDLAPRIWENWTLLTVKQLRALGREQLENPVPGDNAEVSRLERQRTGLRRGSAATI